MNLGTVMWDAGVFCRVTAELNTCFHTVLDLISLVSLPFDQNCHLPLIAKIRNT